MLWRRSSVWVRVIDLHLAILIFIFEDSRTLSPRNMWKYGSPKHRLLSSLSLQCLSSLDWIVSASLQIRWASSCQLTGLITYKCAPGEQGRAVSIATIALTAAHIIGIIAMSTWFVARLEWNKTYFRYIRRNILWWVISLHFCFCIFRFARIFLYDRQVVDLTYEILMAVGWEQVAPPHKLLCIARKMSEISGLLRLWFTRGSMKVAKIVIDKLRPVVLQVKTYIRNRIYQLIRNIKSIRRARSRTVDAESQLEAPGSNKTDNPQALVHQAEVALNTLIETANQGIFKESNLARDLTKYFRKWKTKEYALISWGFRL